MFCVLSGEFFFSSVGRPCCVCIATSRALGVREGCVSGVCVALLQRGVLLAVVWVLGSNVVAAACALFGVQPQFISVRVQFYADSPIQAGNTLYGLARASLSFSLSCAGQL